MLPFESCPILARRRRTRYGQNTSPLTIRAHQPDRLDQVLWARRPATLLHLLCLLLRGVLIEEQTLFGSRFVLEFHPVNRLDWLRIHPVERHEELGFTPLFN